MEDDQVSSAVLNYFGTWVLGYLVLVTWYLLLGTWYLVLGLGHQVEDDKVGSAVLHYFLSAIWVSRQIICKHS